MRCWGCGITTNFIHADTVVLYISRGYNILYVIVSLHEIQNENRNRASISLNDQYSWQGNRYCYKINISVIRHLPLHY